MFNVGKEFSISTVAQIDCWQFGCVWIVPAVLLPQSYPNGTGEGFFVAGWHLENHHYLFVKKRVT